mmetsp:Transcript_4367/g.4960  ORF Transcript_4367/g.4960 Transcript_4367/m.4960 type:complete len:259 (+) Transcript_4367:66-842(+)
MFASDTKGTRYDNNTLSKSREKKFLEVHLHILMSLYKDEFANSEANDVPVEEKYWESIKHFLKERRTIKITTERVQRMGFVCEEAIEFEVNHTIKRKKSLKESNLSYALITQPSPFLNRSSHVRPWTGTTSKPNDPKNSSRKDDLNYYTKRGDNLEMAGGNAFGIVSGLLKLKRRHHLVSTHLNLRISTLRALVTESQNRIENLNSRVDIERYNFKNSEENNEIVVVAKETDEDFRVRIETKKGLWKLLLRDLTETLK